MQKALLLFILVLFSSIKSFSQSTPDSLLDNKRVKITLETGTIKVGYLIHDNDVEVKIWSESFGFLRIEKIKIQEIEMLDSKLPKTKKELDTNNREYLHFNAITNSAIAPKKGDIYIRSPYYIAGCVDYGINNHLTIGFGAFWFTSVNLNVRYSFDLSEIAKLSLSIGTYYTYLGGSFSSNNSLLTARAVYTMGTPEKNFSIGGTFVTNFGRLETALAHFSSMHKLSRKVFFLSDITIAPNLRALNWDVNYIGIGFVGLRIKTKKANRLDLGFANIFLESYNYTSLGFQSERMFIPIPYVQLAYKL